MAQRVLYSLFSESRIPMAQRLLHRLLLAISFDNPNGTATVTQTSFGNLFWQSQWHSNCYTDFFWQFLLTIPMAQGLLHRLLLAISFDNPSGTATVTQTSFGNFFWQSQWDSDCYTDFFWQFHLTIPMAQRLLHRLLLAIFFDNPNGTATVTQTSFGNFFWQSQWHSDCYTDFFWQSFSTIPMAQRLLHRLLLAIFSTIPMAQRLLHRLLLTIFFDNPNGTATVTQTSFGNLFWQSQWHSMCHIVFVDCPCIYPPQRPNTATETRFSERTMQTTGQHTTPKRKSPCNVPLGLTLPNGRPALQPKIRQDLATEHFPMER